MIKKVLTYSLLSAIFTLTINWSILKIVLLDPGMQSSGLGGIAVLFGLGLILLVTSAIVVFVLSWRHFHSFKSALLVLLLTTGFIFGIFLILSGQFQQGLTNIFQKNVN